jgi:NADH-quinone oxidoreductase subunit B
MGFMLKKVGDLLDPAVDPLRRWAYRSSLWPLTFGIMCCAIEMMSSGTGRFDGERFGVIFRPSPRQSDVIIVNGPVSHKMAPRLRLLWDQLPDPKWAIAMGECATSGGPFWECYSIIGGADEIIPIDVYLPGCPVRPEALFYGICKLQEKIKYGKKCSRPNVPNYMDEYSQALVDGKENKAGWENMPIEDVESIPAQGPLARKSD